MLTGNKLITPPVSEGCVEWSYEKAGLGILKKMDHLEGVEAISPFDLQKQTNYLSQTLSREYSP
jgi:branched-chain amino acid aminotransferase